MKIVRWIALLTVTIILLPAALPLSQVFAYPPCLTTITSNTTLSGNCSSSTNGIELAASGITLNCASYTIQLTGTGPPTDYYWAVKVASGYVGDTVENCVLSVTTHGAYGIYAEFTSGLTLTGNTVTGGTYGYYIYDASNIQLTGNTATSSEYGFELQYAYNILLSGNTATGATGDGFYLYDGAVGLLTKNTATGATLDGFYLYLETGSLMYVLNGNTANNNNAYGYYDRSYGPGTLGLANTYINNECSGNTAGGSYDYVAGITGSAAICTA